MKKLVTGFVGWRGMVGSVLMQRMQVENDFALIEPVFYSTSNAGAEVKNLAGQGSIRLHAADDIEKLKKMDVIITCQGGDYTKAIYPKLMSSGWKGHWIDAASTLRTHDDSVIVLDPVNLKIIQHALQRGGKLWVGANCTVSCMLMGIGKLIELGLVEWISSMSYQAASGAGAQNMRELISQFAFITKQTQTLLDDPASSILALDQSVRDAQQHKDFPNQHFGVPLAASLIPWIDSDLGNGVSREEWKAAVETRKIMGLAQEDALAVDGLCVRVGSMRSHAMALTIKLIKDIAIDDIHALIGQSHAWVKLVPNTKEAATTQLSPASTSGSLDIAIGRIRKLAMGSRYMSALVIGDQLLWGAAEPLRRMLGIIITNKFSN